METVTNHIGVDRLVLSEEEVRFASELIQRFKNHSIYTGVDAGHKLTNVIFNNAPMMMPVDNAELQKQIAEVRENIKSLSTRLDTIEKDDGRLVSIRDEIVNLNGRFNDLIPNYGAF